MIIENRDGLIIIYAEGTNKLTNKSRDFYSDLVYLGINDSQDNYEEVSKSIWKNFIEVVDEDLEDVKENLKTLEEKVENDKLELQEENMMQDELILSTMDAIAETYETGLLLQEDNMMQDELILTTMDAVATSYEDILETQTTNMQNEENILVSMDAIAELYETIMNLTLEIEALKGGVDNGDSNE